MVKKNDISLIFCNNYLVAANKPPGLEIVGQNAEADVLSLIRRQLDDDGVQPVHRLDRDTSGLVLFSRTPEAERELTELFKRREMKKTYLALCFGAPFNSSGSINRALSPWRGGHKPVQVVKGKGGLEAKTDYRLLASRDYPDIPGFDAVSLLAFYPHQGRTHQIRVHASALGYPIVADDQYGVRPANKWAARSFSIRRQALHAYRLAFSWRGETMELTAPVPSDMAAVIREAFPRHESP